MGEKENYMFEYVTKAEYKPVKQELSFRTHRAFNGSTLAHL